MNDAPDVIELILAYGNAVRNSERHIVGPTIETDAEWRTHHDKLRKAEEQAMAALRDALRPDTTLRRTS